MATSSRIPIRSPRKLYRVSLGLVMFNFTVCMVSLGVLYLVAGTRGLSLSLVFVAVLVAGAGRSPYLVTLRHDQAVEFRSLLDRVIVYPDEIRSVATPPIDCGFVLITHQGGCIRLSRMLDGFPDLVSELCARNPEIRLVRLAGRLD